MLLRTGIQCKGVLQMAEELLSIKKHSSITRIDEGLDGISGFLLGTADDLKRVKRLGPAKRSKLVAVLANGQLFRGTLIQLSGTLLRKYFGWLRYWLPLLLNTPRQSQPTG